MFLKDQLYSTHKTHFIMVNATDADDDGFVTVVRKKKQSKVRHPPVKLNRDDVIAQVSKMLSECILNDQIIASFLYGSTAKNLNTSFSDLDIALVFNNRIPDHTALVAVKTMLESSYQRNVDLVYFVTKNKWVDESGVEAQCFVENVIDEGRYIWGVDGKSHSTSILQFSKLCGKVRY